VKPGSDGKVPSVKCWWTQSPIHANKNNREKNVRYLLLEACRTVLCCGMPLRADGSEVTVRTNAPLTVDD
jgi:hypothetical protein